MPLSRVADQTLLVDIGPRRLFARVRGGGPTIVLLSGADVAGVGAWDPLESRLAEFATVVSYDRAGTGRSDPPASAAKDWCCSIQHQTSCSASTLPLRSRHIARPTGTHNASETGSRRAVPRSGGRSKRSGECRMCQ